MARFELYFERATGSNNRSIANQIEIILLQPHSGKFIRHLQRQAIVL